MKEKINAIIADLDGTISNLNGRSPFKYHLSKYDLVQEKVTNYIRDQFNKGIKIIILSGRGKSSQIITEKWLLDNNIPYTKIYMKPDNDYRKSVFYKEYILRTEILPYYNVIEVIDDYKKNLIMFNKYNFNLTYVDEKTGDMFKNYIVE